jgi:hypothetical protein
MSQTVSLRLPNELVDRLDRFARRLGNGTTRSRASMILLDEALREEEFSGIEFRNTTVGRQPYIARCVCSLSCGMRLRRSPGLTWSVM